MIKLQQKSAAGGVRIVMAAVLALTLVGGSAVGWRHWHHANKPPASYNDSGTNTNPADFNTPPVPGTENVRAQPLYDYQEVHQLSEPPSASPGTINPTTMRNAYQVPTGNGGSGTIALVEAYDNRAAESDLAVFDSNYSLPACTTANGCFEKFKMGPNLTDDSGWDQESSLDIDWAHAIAPNARILVVEAQSNLISDLMNAVDYARSRPDVVAVSMSWGSNEFSGETGYDSRLTSIHGVAFFAASGDSGHNVWWPAASPNVIGVGGTSLSINGGGMVTSETAWSGSGGGVSIYESEPSYQSTYGIVGSGGFRGVPDVSYAADPTVDPMPIYDSTPNAGLSGWLTIGGTSAGSPQLAAMQAVGRRFTLARLYADATGAGYSSYFRDITSGNNGGCGTICNAATNYDYVTGLGSPLTTQF